MSRCLLLLLLVPSLAAPPVAMAHHSYAMFDASRSVTVRGTVARLEWRNPHVYLWVYVPRPGGDGHDLYGFENGGVPVSRWYMTAHSAKRSSAGLGPPSGAS